MLPLCTPFLPNLKMAVQFYWSRFQSFVKLQTSEAEATSLFFIKFKAMVSLSHSHKIVCCCFYFEPFTPTHSSPRERKQLLPSGFRLRSPQGVNTSVLLFERMNDIPSGKCFQRGNQIVRVHLPKCQCYHHSHFQKCKIFKNQMRRH